jgi:hypothetical protein
MHEFSSPAIKPLCKNARIQLSGYKTPLQKCMNSALRLKNSSVKMHEFSSPAIELLCKNA